MYEYEKPYIEPTPTPDDSGAYGINQVAETMAMRNSGALADAAEAVAIGNQDWMQNARCKEITPSVFFPSSGVGVGVAKRICAECPVKTACLNFALANRIDHGVWGGTSERERRRIYKNSR